MSDEVLPTPRGPSAWAPELFAKPTTVVADHTAPGSTAVPSARQLVKQAQVAGATPLPPPQAKPTGHGAPAAVVDPGGQPHPAAVLQLALQAGVARFVVPP